MKSNRIRNLVLPVPVMPTSSGATWESSEQLDAPEAATTELSKGDTSAVAAEIPVSSPNQPNPETVHLESYDGIDELAQTDSGPSGAEDPVQSAPPPIELLAERGPAEVETQDSMPENLEKGQVVEGPPTSLPTAIEDPAVGRVAAEAPMAGDINRRIDNDVAAVETPPSTQSTILESQKVEEVTFNESVSPNTAAEADLERTGSLEAIQDSSSQALDQEPVPLMDATAKPVALTPVGHLPVDTGKGTEQTADSSLRAPLEDAQAAEEELPDWLIQVVQRGQPQTEPSSTISATPASAEPILEQSPEIYVAPSPDSAEGQKSGTSLLEASVTSPLEPDSEQELVNIEAKGETPVSPSAVDFADHKVEAVRSETLKSPITEGQSGPPVVSNEGFSENGPPAGEETHDPTATPQLSDIATDKSLPESDAVPAWMSELIPPAEIRQGISSRQMRTEPPQLQEDEREELPDWLREPIALEGSTAPSASKLESETAALTPRPEKAIWMEQPAYGLDREISGRPLEELTETEGPLAGVLGVLPLALGIKEPHTIVPPSRRENEGALVFQSVLAAAAEGSIVSTPVKAPYRSWSKWWINIGLLIAVLIPFFIPSNLAGLGLIVNNATPTARFYDRIQSLPSGSNVLLSFDYDAGQAVELTPAARLIVLDLARRNVNVLAMSTLPTGAQIAERVLQDASQQNPGWTFGEHYVNLGYVPGGEAGLRAMAERWLSTFQNDSLAALPLTQKLHGLDDFALAVEFAGSDTSLRAWMEQVQPRRQVTFVAALSAAQESQARNYLASGQLAAFLRGLGGAAEYELFSNQTGLTVRTVDAQSFSHLAISAVILLGNLALVFERLRKAGRSNR